MPARGSGALPENRPAERASSTSASPLARLSSMSPVPRSSFARSVGVNRPGSATYSAAPAGPVSIARPSARHFGSPPSSTATASCPNSRISHHPRAAENRPLAS